MARRRRHLRSHAKSVMSRATGGGDTAPCSALRREHAGPSTAAAGEQGQRPRNSDSQTPSSQPPSTRSTRRAGAALQHLREYRVGVGAAPTGAFGLVVVHPGEHHDLGRGAEAKEEPVLLEKLGAAPVLPLRPKRVALLEPLIGWVSGNVLERKLKHGGEHLGVAPACVALGIFPPCALDPRHERVELVEKERVGVDFPATDLHLVGSERSIEIDLNVVNQILRPRDEALRHGLKAVGAGGNVAFQEIEEAEQRGSARSCSGQRRRTADVGWARCHIRAPNGTDL